MTNVTFYIKNDSFYKVEASGHACYADYGNDIVCCAISTSLQSLALGVLKVLNIKAEYKTKENKGYLLLKLPDVIKEENLNQTNLLFTICLETLKDIKKGYPKQINLEVRENVY